MADYQAFKNFIRKIPGAVWAHHAITRSPRALAFRLRGKTRFSQAYYPPLSRVLGPAKRRSHLSDHLGTIFFFALEARPRLMVELGTNQGESTRVLLTAAHMTQSRLLSMDIQDCGHLDLPFKERWSFVRSDDVAFGQTSFVKWCRDRSIEPEIDLLFIDTSHLLEHAQQELATWSPFLSGRGTMLLHDTNMGRGLCARLDGSIDFGFDNQRGVIRAVEAFLGRRYDETSFFSDVADGWLLLHHPHCNGLLVLKKYQPLTQGMPH